ncbi:TetR/AcrR family transcriptional regulator [Actinosynnema sp. NPDC020468]|uniref:TetR/AcrR family transcriptional regulator n=1 Tax=Actinosynnema sp. NPDC020468 TaxID=3154488 RepID=UPI0034063A6C
MSTTRDSLLAAAATAFDQNGYVRATIDDVCDLAGVTKGALYGHFSSKKALAVAVLDRQAQEWVRTREQLQQTHRSPLQVMVDLGYAVHRDHLVAQRLLFQSPICDDVADRQIAQWTWTNHELLRAAAFRGELLDGIDLGGCAEAMVAALVGAHLVSMAIGDADHVNARIAGMWRAWLPTLARPEVCAALRLAAPRVRPR